MEQALAPLEGVVEGDEFEVEWDLRDNQGKPVPEGIYLIEAFIKVEPPCKLWVQRGLMFVGSVPTLDDLVDVRMEVPSEVPLGEPVRLKLQVENITEYPLILYTGAMMYDFLVSDEAGKMVWAWSHGRVFPMYGAIIVLQPGEVKEYEESPWGTGDQSPRRADVPTSVWVEWEQCDMNCTSKPSGPCCGDSVPPGTYQAWGSLSAELSDGIRYYVASGYGVDSKPQEFIILP